jgi:TRAP transporter TAXI family solute receptor
MNSNGKGAVSIFVAAVWLAAFNPMGKAGAIESAETVTIATGKVGGIYHPVGGAICKLVNDRAAEHGISCTIEITGGSWENIRDLRAGEVALAMAQSDSQHSAFKGIGPFEEAGPFDTMRSMFAPYVEQFTLVARDDAGIGSFKDLKGKRVHMGRPGSGKRETMDVILDAFGWSRDDVQDISEFKASNVAEALCDNEIDAFVHTIGHPSPLVREAVATCRAVIAPVSGRAIDRLANNSAIYVSTVIPRGTYQNQSSDIPTLGLVATLVTTEKIPSDVVYEVTKAFFENLDRLREASPLFWSLTTREMVSIGRTAPLHEGASRYFTEAGLQ